ncbi:hypothetical protein PX669_19425 (plasmid) [Acinetobacter soli]|nr:hypothetical protein PX669_19425 [Acinetobacter soli]
MDSENFNENEMLVRIKPTFISKLIPIKSRVGRYAKYRYFCSTQHVTPPVNGSDNREEDIKRVAKALGLTYRLVSEKEWVEALQYSKKWY